MEAEGTDVMKEAGFPAQALAACRERREPNLPHNFHVIPKKPCPPRIKIRHVPFGFQDVISMQNFTVHIIEGVFISPTCSTCCL